MGSNFQLCQGIHSRFCQKVARGLEEGTNKKERPLVVEEKISGLEEHEEPEMAPEALQLQKRRRVYAKQPETSFHGKAPMWEDVFRTVGHRTPRVGNFYFGEDVSGMMVLLRWIKGILWERLSRSMFQRTAE